jgi:hypothetical protein
MWKARSPLHEAFLDEWEKHAILFVQAVEKGTDMGLWSQDGSSQSHNPLVLAHKLLPRSDRIDVVRCALLASRACSCPVGLG